MCGIVYKQSFTGVPVNQAIAQMYKLQRSRGHEGFGFFVPEVSRLAHNVREDRILKLLHKPQYQGTQILFHHRWPTSTENRQSAAHPFSTRSNEQLFDHNYVMVHNGVVHNSRELQEAHEKLGIRYVSEGVDGRFNDSEALLYDLALYLDGKQTELKARGSIAFIILKDNELYFGRNAGSPLLYDLNSRGLTIRSEGNGEVVKTDTLYHFEADRKAFVTSELKIPQYATYNGGGYGAGYSSGANWKPSEGSKPQYLDRHWWAEDDDDYEVEPYDMTGYGAPTTHKQSYAYIDAMNYAKTFGSAETAIEHMEEKIENLDKSIEIAEEAYRRDDSLTNSEALSELQEDLEDAWTMVGALYAVYEDDLEIEEEETLRLGVVSEANLAGGDYDTAN